MTCEIIVMNRHAVALAADSAVTVTQWANGTEEKRYFKGVNKLFQISKDQPVGMMVYGSGDLQQAPWELLAKEYRSHLGTKSFGSLEEYGSDLFSFIQNSVSIFPRDYQEEVFQVDCNKAALIFFSQQIGGREEYKNANDDEKIVFFNDFVGETLNNLDTQVFLPHFDQGDLDEAIKLFLEPITRKITETLEAYNIVADGGKLAEFAIKSIYKLGFSMGETGIVVAGFGDKDFYPGYQQYTCYGNILGKCAFKKEESSQINYYNHSQIKGFATTQMIDTFRFGISIDSFQAAGIECESSLRKLAERLGQTDANNLESMITEEGKSFRQALIGKCGEKNYGPLTRVVAALPVDDMAELAETLVTLESLKEKVTQPTESVGGPVDVAVITRSEGLVWIKRKHYFSPEINPRYFQRSSK